MLKDVRSALLFALLAPAAVAQQPVYHAVREPVVDPALATGTGGFMMAIDGLLVDFLIAGGGQFVQLPDGTARMTGRMFSQSSVYWAFAFDIHLTGRVDPGGPGYPPIGAPDLELQSNSYAPIGPVDPSAFVYYTAATGRLVGSRWYDGLVLDVTSSGPIQVGLGANNRNGSLGLEARFQVSVVQQLPFPVSPTGTATMTLDLPDHKTFFATHPLPDSLRSNLVDGRAMVMPGLGDDYLFVPAGSFTEYSDGHAEVRGTLARISHLEDAWDVALDFTSRLDPGEANYPPSGSPVLQLLPSAYLSGGGFVDPAHWRYYRVASGTLTGRKLNEGGVVTLSNNIAVQVGDGVNQANAYIGYYGTFTANVASQPTARTIAVTGPVEVFSTTAVFPVLPFPELVTPAVNPTLSTLTDQGFVVEGDHLAWAEQIAIGWDIVGFKSPEFWYQGYFKVLDNQHVEVHPRPGAVPGNYPLAVINPVIPSNSIQIDLVAPTSPKLYSEANVPAWWPQHVLTHSGPVTGPAFSLNMISTSLTPSLAPGFLSLDIGNAFSELIIDFTLRPNDPVTGIAVANYTNVPSDFGGLLWHFQGIVLDFGDPTWLWGVTNPFSVQY